MRVWGAIYGDGALLGATDDDAGVSRAYWGEWQHEDGFGIVEVIIPDHETELLEDHEAEKFLRHGTHEQYFADGYEAFEAMKQYPMTVIDWPEEGIKHWGITEFVPHAGAEVTFLTEERKDG